MIDRSSNIETTEPLEFEDETPPTFVESVLKLLRLPNVFTAWADIALGYWMVQPVTPFGNHWELSLLIAASSCLYLAGMVWNDVFDIEVDRRERPERPLPSGAVSLAFARGLAVALSLAGIVFAGSLGTVPWAVAFLLLAAVLFYDGIAKFTAFGPAVMGLCRTLNVLLGLSPFLMGLATKTGEQHAFLPDGIAMAVSLLWWTIPLGNGVYTAGFTLFAKSEVLRSHRTTLCTAATIMAAGLALHFWSLAQIPRVERSAVLLLAFVSGVVALRVARALVKPEPRFVQQAVVAAITSLITIDAALILAIQGRNHAMMIIALLPASILLGRWFYRT